MVVVGASSAGLRAAGLLAAEGLRVAVFERQRKLGHPERTWIATPEIEPVLGFSLEESIVHRTGVLGFVAGKACGTLRLTPPDLIVERAKIIPSLAQRVEAGGGEIHLGTAVRELRTVNGRIELETGGNGNGRTSRIQARHVIGADGVRSVVARVFEAAPQVAVPIVQAKVALPTDYDPDVTKVWFHRSRTCFFYWLIPDSRETGVVGLVAEESGHSRQLLDDFMAEHGFRPISYQGAMIPLHQPSRRIDWTVDGARVMLVGDAAAHVKVTTVGGLVTGLWGARAAARSLIRETPYRRELRSLNREISVHGLVRWFLNRFEDPDYELLVRSLNGPLRSVLAGRNRDMMAGAWWRLVSAQPQLLRLAVTAILRPHRARYRAPMLGSAGVMDGAD